MEAEILLTAFFTWLLIWQRKMLLIQASLRPHEMSTSFLGLRGIIPSRVTSAQHAQT